MLYAYLMILEKDRSAWNLLIPHCLIPDLLTARNFWVRRAFDWTQPEFPRSPEFALALTWSDWSFVSEGLKNLHVKSSTFVDSITHRLVMCGLWRLPKLNASPISIAVPPGVLHESRAIAGRTVRCRCKFRYVSNWQILQRHRTVSLPRHGVLAHISDRSNAEIAHSTLTLTAVTQNHGHSRKWRHTPKITVKVTVIVNTWLSYSANVTVSVHAYVR